MSFIYNTPQAQEIGFQAYLSGALDLRFIGVQAIDSRITFTRGSAATYFDQFGTLTIAGTNAPRLDYNPATLEPRGLLIEESRANLATYSGVMSNAAGWTAQENLSVASVATANPFGVTNVTQCTTSAGGSGYLDKTVSYTSGTTYTFSVYAKASSTSSFTILLYGSSFNGGGANVTGTYNLSTGIATSTGSPAGVGMVAIGGGWYRCWLTQAATVTSSNTNQFIRLNNASESVFVFGAQIEAGAFPTSYIPTTTTALTRAADVANVNTLAPWYNATEGTLYVQAQDMSDAAHGTSQPRAASLNDTTTNNTIDISRIPASAQGRARIDVGGANQFNSLTTAWPLATQAKVALAYKANDYAACLGGGTVVTNTASSLIPTVTALSIGDIRTTVSNHWVGWIQRVAYYPRRLTNAELQAITA